MTGAAELSAAAKAVQTALQKLDQWRKAREAAAQTKEEKTAARVLYNAEVIPLVCRGLNEEFKALNARVQALDENAAEADVEAVADAVEDLADREDLVGRLIRAVAFLQRHSASAPNRFGRILRKVARKQARTDAEQILVEIASLGEQALKVVGARERYATPAGVVELEAHLRSARTPQEIRQAKTEASGVLSRIDRTLLRDAHEKIGKLTSALTEAYGLPAPEEIGF
jgi:hypothetical protein